MIYQDPLVFAASFLLMVVASLAVLVASRHAWIARRDERHLELAEEVRPLLASLLAEDDPDLARFEAEAHLAGDLVDELAETFLSKLRGRDRSVLVDLLEERGTLATARRDLRSRRPLVRARAAQLLGAAADASSLPDLAAMLQDPDGTVRTVAIRALGRIGDPAAVPLVMDAIGDGSTGLPAHAARMGLLRIGNAAVAPLVAGLDHPSAAARLAAVEVLGHLGAPEAADSLSEMLIWDPDHQIRLAAVAALDRIGTPVAFVGLCVGATKADNAELRAAATEALKGGPVLDLISGEAGLVDEIAGPWLGLLSERIDPRILVTLGQAVDGGGMS